MPKHWSWFCTDCNVDTSHDGIQEYYMLKSPVWVEAYGNDTHINMLCIGCVEKRLGRQLVNDDFLDCGLNEIGEKSDRLKDRLLSSRGIV